MLIYIVFMIFISNFIFYLFLFEQFIETAAQLVL